MTHNSARKIKNDLEKISYWAYQWKMQLNLDPNKQANEAILSRKTSSNNLSHPPIKFNKIGISECPHQKHLGIVLDSKLNFNAHVDQKIKKCNGVIGLIIRLSVTLPRNALLTIYKTFVRPHLDYGDLLYDKPNNENFQNKLEKVQYRACLAITGAIRGTSRTKLYDELGLYSLIKRRWCNKLTFLYKIVNGLLPRYLYSYLDFLSQINYSLRSVSASVIKPSLSRAKSFKNTFFPYCINEWNNLTVEIKNSKSVGAFKKLIKCEKKENSIFSIYDPLGIKLFNRLRIQFSNLNEHKFRHGFGDTINAMCACGSEVETTEHFLLSCHLYSPQSLELFGNLEKIESGFLNLKVKEKVSFYYMAPNQQLPKVPIMKFLVLFCIHVWVDDVIKKSNSYSLLPYRQPAVLLRQF